MNLPDTNEPRLPPAVAALVDGTGLESKIGITILLTAVDGDGWPRQALLSVGEVLSVSGADLRLALYAGSRTTRALASSGQALLTVVAAEAAYKVCADLAPVGSVAGLACFAGRVVAVDEDRVGYARISGGISYQLPDPQPVLRRWDRQIAQLRAAAP